MRTTNIRFSGMASGLDTESMVKALTMKEQNAITKSKQAKLLMEMRRDKYKEVSTKVDAFTRKWAGQARLESTFNKTNSTVSDPTKVSVSGSSVSGTHSVDFVTQLASSAKLTTTSLGKDSNTPLSDVIDFTGVDSIVFKVDDGSGEKEVVLTPDMKLSELGNKLNQAMPNTNVKYDPTAKGFFVSSKKTGDEQKFSISAYSRVGDVDTANSDVLGKLGVGTGATVTATGGNLVMEYNGMPVESQTNTVSVNGLNITINAAFDTPVTINTEQDTEAMVTYVKDFITEYNNLVDELNFLEGAPVNRDYDPLTDEQKKDMTDEDIKLWNEKINNSLLSGDPTLRKLTQDMRDVMGGVVDGLGVKTLKDLGIEATSWKDKGKLSINETKLREAINTNPDDVVALFAGREGSPGIADKLYDVLDANFKASKDLKSAVSIFNDKALDTKIKQESSNLSKLEDRLSRMEALHYAKFTAMEKMMSQLNSQSSWLSAQMGGM